MKDDELEINGMELKIGARNSARDQKRIQDAHDLLVENGATCQTGKSLDPATVLVITGGEVKALEGGKVGGYLVRFTTPTDPDLTGDYFSSSTDFGDAKTSPVLYHHGYDSKIGARRLGTGELRADNVGVWIDAQLNLRDEYEKAIYELAQAGKLGWSSGTAGHLVTREAAGKAWLIKSWPLGLDASLTPTPAEPRNSAVTLKSLLPEPEGAGDAPAAATKSTPVIEEPKMELTEIEVKNIVKAALEQEREAAKAAEIKAAELKAAEEAGYKKALAEVQPYLKHAPAYVQKPGDDNDGVDAFKSWLRTGQENSSLIAPPAWMKDTKAAYNITTGASGGFAVPDPLYNQIIAKRNIASWVRQAPVQQFTTTSDHLLIPTEDTSQTAFVLTAESAAYSNNEGTLAQTDLALLKYTKEVRATEEFMAGENSNFDAWLMETLGRAEAVTENTLATTAILATSTAAAAAASATALTVAEMERLIGSLGAGYNVQGECGFLMKNATKYYLKGVNYGTYQNWDFDGYPVYISDDMPAMTAGLRSTLFANFRMFAVLERPGMLVQRNPWLYMANGKIGIFANIYRGFAGLQAEATYTMAQA